MLTSTLFLLILSTIVNSSEFEEFMMLYNTKTYSAIYNQFSVKATTDTPQDVFIQYINAIQKQHGQIKYYQNITIDSVQNLYLIGFAETLQAGLMNWKYNTNKELTHFHINSYGNISLFEYFNSNQEKFFLTFFFENKLYVDTQPNKMSQIQGLNKITILLEFCRQSSIKLIDPFNMIPINYLNKFYIKEFDFGHEQFLSNMKISNKIINGSLQLWDIASGLILFDSNCIAEFLQTLLGRDQIEQTLSALNFISTEQTWTVSQQLAFINLYNQEYEEYILRISKLTYSNFVQLHNFMHNQLEAETENAKMWLENAHVNLQDGRVLEIMSQYFIMSNTNQYTNLIRKMQNREYTYFSTLTYEYFEKIMLMTGSSLSSRNLLNFDQLGMKFERFGMNYNNNNFMGVIYYDRTQKSSKTKQFGILINQLNYEEYVEFQPYLTIFLQLLRSNNEYYLDMCNKIQQSYQQNK